MLNHHRPHPSTLLQCPVLLHDGLDQKTVPGNSPGLEFPSHGQAWYQTIREVYPLGIGPACPSSGARGFTLIVEVKPGQNTGLG